MLSSNKTKYLYNKVLIFVVSAEMYSTLVVHNFFVLFSRLYVFVLYVNLTISVSR